MRRGCSFMWGFTLVGISLLCLTSFVKANAQQYIDSFLEASQSANDSFLKGDFNAAFKEEKRALSLAHGKYGLFHPSLVPILNDLAALNRTMGHYQEAELNYKLGLSIREQGLGLDDPLVAESLDNLAALYDDLERDEEALILEQRAWRIRESQQGFIVNETYLRELLRQGKTLIRLKKYDDAQKTLGKSLEMADKSLHLNNPLKNEFLEAMADAEMGCGHPELAEKLFLKSLELKKERLTENSYEVGDLYKKLGDFYKVSGKKDESRVYYQKALKIHLRYVGKICEYLNVARFEEASNDYQALGNHEDSLKLRKQALKTLTDIWGKDHPLTAICQAEVAEDEAVLGDKDEAISNFRQALAVLRVALGPDHTLAIGVMKRLEDLAK